MEHTPTCQPEQPAGQETTIVKSRAGCTVILKCIGECNKSELVKKMDDESGTEEETMSKEEWEETTTDGSDDGSSGDDETSGTDMPIVESAMYELSQSYELEPEYDEITPEQEAVEVQAMTPREQAEYQELTKFHQHQAEVKEKLTGMSKIIEERTKAWAPGLLI